MAHQQKNLGISTIPRFFIALKYVINCQENSKNGVKKWYLV
nr:MAG TPA: hypothetical protein [Caudoviricetes sp.]